MFEASFFERVSTEDLWILLEITLTPKLSTNETFLFFHLHKNQNNLNDTFISVADRNFSS